MFGKYAVRIKMKSIWPCSSGQRTLVHVTCMYTQTQERKYSWIKGSTKNKAQLREMLQFTRNFAHLREVLLKYEQYFVQ